MEHRLSRLGADVVYRAVPVLDPAFASEFRGNQLAIAEQLSVFRSGLFQPDNMSLGNDQHMRRGLGIDVLENEHLFILDRKSTRLNSSHLGISYAVFCLKKKKNT